MGVAEVLLLGLCLSSLRHLTPCLPHHRILLRSSHPHPHTRTSRVWLLKSLPSKNPSQPM
ncbi:hypothetical protein BDV93DRAFT_148979 [Ceratobasidium sp. AG-I]|nr:hypothetical protein BDV93DRAFT_148979 [Ceratobasidium sp. AG-I]